MNCASSVPQPRPPLFPRCILSIEYSENRAHHLPALVQTV
jgi:hypothetical protein